MKTDSNNQGNKGVVRREKRGAIEREIRAELGSSFVTPPDVNASELFFVVRSGFITVPRCRKTPSPPQKHRLAPEESAILGHNGFKMQIVYYAGSLGWRGSRDEAASRAPAKDLVSSL